MPHFNFYLNIEYLVYSWPILFILLLSGFGITSLILPKEKLHLLLFVCPWVGFCYISLGCWYLYFYGFEGTDSYAWYILYLSVLFLILGVKRLLNLKILLKQIVNLDAIIGYSIGALAYVVISTPQILSGSVATKVLGNNDMAEYGIESRVLKEFARHTHIGFAANGQLQSLIDHNYFGPTAFAAFSSSILKLMPHQLLSICINIFFSLSVLAFYHVGKDIFKLNRGWLWVAAFCYTINAVIQFIAYNGYYPQIIGTGLSLLLFYLVVECCLYHGEGRVILTICPLFLIFTWGIFISYPHMLVIINFSFLIYATVYSLCDRSYGAVKTVLGMIVLSLVFVWALSPFRMYSFLLVFMGAATGKAGWFIPYLWLNELIGVGLFTGFRNPWYINLLISIVVVSLLSVLYVKLPSDSQRKLTPFLSMILAVFLGSWVLAYSEHEPEGFGGYKSFKFLSYFLPFVLLCFSVIVCNGVEYCSKMQKHMLSICCVFMVCAMAVTSIVLTQYVLKNGKAVPRFYQELVQIENKPDIVSINILGDSFWEPMWKSYFLLRKSLYFQAASYYPASALNGEYDLQTLGTESAETVLLFKQAKKKSNDMQVTPRLKYFSLIRHEDGSRAFVKFGNGWWGDEKNHRWAGSSGKKFSIEILSEVTYDNIKLELFFHPSHSNDRLTISLNGLCLVGNTSDAGELVLEKLNLHKGMNVLAFESLLDPQQINIADLRTLSYMFKKIHFIDCAE